MTCGRMLNPNSRNTNLDPNNRNNSLEKYEEKRSTCFILREGKNANKLIILDRKQFEGIVLIRESILNIYKISTHTISISSDRLKRRNDTDM